MNYIVFDLEWNRLVKAVKTRCPDEIIQIGAVKYNSQMKCTGTFSRLIKPVLYKKIDPMVGNLTGLEMAILKSDGIPFAKAIKEFKKLCNDYFGIEEGILYTSYDISQESLKQVEQAIGKVENKLVKLNVVKDPTLIGGIKVEVNNRVFDGTIKNKVSLLKKELLRK